MKSYDKVFITGVDSKTMWMLDWFQDGFYKHNPDAELLIYNFDESFTHLEGWFKKPYAMMNAAQKADKVCWLDVDIEIVGSYDGVWDWVRPNVLTMAKDGPWTKRRRETWHNSGVVAFQNQPQILFDWCSAVESKNHGQRGDQEVLHMLMTDELRRMTHIQDLPKKYNTLRIDLLDGTAPKDIHGMHWTGKKGKDHIKGLIENV